MTARPNEHVIGDQAAAAVRLIWNRQGAAVDEIHKDYGEDLLVKTRVRGRVDPRPIWVQVKGTERNCLDEGTNLPSVNLSVRQLIRWSRFGDPVLVVLWDVANNVGWYAIPADHDFDFTTLLEAGQKKVSIPFSRDAKFDTATADILAWEARLLAAMRLMKASYHDMIDVAEDDIEAAGRIREDIHLQLIDVMHDLSIVTLRGDGYSFTPAFRPALRAAAEHFDQAKEGHETQGELLDHSLISALFALMPPGAVQVIPSVLFGEIAQITKRAHFSHDHEVWDGPLTWRKNQFRAFTAESESVTAG
ncbi:DUF4365 domain-containing protein [Saccharopolyspora sp. SCSIO 74807]|uniref:DUF4365 domain-containing protein n=1 Tax=Saccharopolyspora sp. SCSIO 74807 TaxID=3118084 RepID=UPI0030D46254